MPKIDGEELTEQEILDRGMCHCGTIRDLIDQSIDLAIKLRNEDCAVWATAKAMVTLQMVANIFNLFEMAKTRNREIADRDTAELLRDMSSLTNDMMLGLKDHVKARIIAKVNEDIDRKNPKEETSEGHVVH